jgi:hypothetical protein
MGRFCAGDDRTPPSRKLPVFRQIRRTRLYDCHTSDCIGPERRLQSEVKQKGRIRQWLRPANSALTCDLLQSLRKVILSAHNGVDSAWLLGNLPYGISARERYIAEHPGKSLKRSLHALRPVRQPWQAHAWFLEPKCVDEWGRPWRLEKRDANDLQLRFKLFGCQCGAASVEEWTGKFTPVPEEDPTNGTEWRSPLATTGRPRKDAAENIV